MNSNENVKILEKFDLWLWLFVLQCIWYSCFGSWDCKDITVDYCVVYPPDIIDETATLTDFEQCQNYCLKNSECVIFRFDGDNCLLLKNDYRKNCYLIGGPYNQSFDSCFDGPTHENCNLLFQEDCMYEGNSIIVTPNGTIAEYHDLSCKYWVYHSALDSCFLYDSREKSCLTWGGPRYPSFSICNENILNNKSWRIIIGFSIIHI